MDNYKLLLPLVLIGCGQEDPLPIAKFDKDLAAWKERGVECIPQQLASRTLKASGNFYSYRDEKVLLDLDSATGIYRRIALSETEDGKPAFTRIQGCFWHRDDPTFGSQLLLDTDTKQLASTEHFDPMEIFRLTEAADTLVMTRFDQTDIWDYTFCPHLDTPWDFCTALRDGNSMYWPNLPPATQSALLNEALLIRREFNYVEIEKGEFESQWTALPGSHKEISRDDVKYQVIATADVPFYIDQAWRDFIKGDRPTMPDTDSNQMPNLCYPGSQKVTLDNGQEGKIFGEICYVDGEYHFTSN